MIIIVSLKDLQKVDVNCGNTCICLKVKTYKVSQHYNTCFKTIQLATIKQVNTQICNVLFVLAWTMTNNMIHTMCTVFGVNEVVRGHDWDDIVSHMILK